MKIFTPITLFLSIVVLISVPTAATNSTGDEAETDKLLFASSIDEFIKAREEAAKTGSTLDFESDGCSKVPDKPLGFNFKASCERHDFGYRNYKNQGRFDNVTRTRIDRNFRKDMWDACANADNKIFEYTYPLANVIAEAANGIQDLLDFFKGNSRSEARGSYNKARDSYYDGYSDGYSGGYYDGYYYSYYDGYYDNSYYDYSNYDQSYYDGSYYDTYYTYDSVESNYNDGQGTYGNGGDNGYSYSEKLVCEVIADTYYYAVEIYGAISGAPGRYGTRDNVYFWGMYVTFLSTLVFKAW